MNKPFLQEGHLFPGPPCAVLRVMSKMHITKIRQYHVETTVA